MDTNERTVQLKTSVASSGNNKEIVHIGFKPMGDTIPTAEDYGTQGEENKQKLNAFLKYMKSVDEQFFKWLEADAQNAILFTNNPVKALKTAIPGFDETILNNLSKDMLR
ncbi:hypothetical protein ABS768_15905 [Flavobacterium sp. ST-75]|uniref:Uncharacterized protein n=1 Tax=Flavobacterium rhizophilum TaxID=3163296 RepID=A0ABW8YFI7_9FLAO